MKKLSLKAILTIVGILASVSLIAYGLSPLVTGSSSATATTTTTTTTTTTPAEATIGSLAISPLTSPEISGTCTPGSGLTSFSCSGTSLTAGDSYTLTGTINNGNPSPETVTIMYTSTWAPTCSVAGTSYNNGDSFSLASGDSSLSCTITSPSGSPSSDSFSFTLSG